jgi:hypothetical protein
VKCLWFEVRVRKQETDDEAIEVHAGADHWCSEGASGGRVGIRPVPDARKLKGLKEENARLKRLLAKSMLDVSTLKERLEKNF